MGNGQGTQRKPLCLASRFLYLPLTLVVKGLLVYLLCAMVLMGNLDTIICPWDWLLAI